MAEQSPAYEELDFLREAGPKEAGERVEATPEPGSLLRVKRELARSQLCSWEALWSKRAHCGGLRQ